MLLRPDCGTLASVETDCKPSVPIIGEALFFAIRVLLARSLRRSSIPLSLNSVFVLVVGCQYGGVINFEGGSPNMETTEITLSTGCEVEECRISNARWRSDAARSRFKGFLIWGYQLGVMTNGSTNNGLEH
ncbi:unnamed protein product [Fraxinus pennsylvanica]|uniref:Uncharacterized protein n=1 Tax=Fraxinus pennsylvanica TaxID=56036 RepID=A0AAD2AJ42_9LAMI|nr:unnamed protein product [Fraxinus pennsylvanica]